MIANALTIAGSDPSGGAGIQADHKTFAAFGVYGCSVITACTAQNTQGVEAVHLIPPAFVAEQLRVLFADVTIHAAKTGMLATVETVRVVAEALAKHPDLPLVVDPVMVATSGHRLLEPSAEQAIREFLLPRASIITPNLPEALVLIGEAEGVLPSSPAAMVDLVDVLRQHCPGAIYLKGGHLPAAADSLLDLFWDGSRLHHLQGSRIESTNTHGTGCSLAAALAAGLARGADLCDVAARAHGWLRQALAAAEQLSVGRPGGHGPINHLIRPDMAL